MCYGNQHIKYMHQLRQICEFVALHCIIFHWQTLLVKATSNWNDENCVIYSITVYSAPPLAVLREMMNSAERVTFYGFLMALAKSETLNNSIGTCVDIIFFLKL